MSVATQSQDTVDYAGAAKDMTAQLAREHEAIERMRVRVHASHAHQQSLKRAALGIQSIHARLMPLLESRAAREGWTPENELAASALGAMQRQLDLIGQDGATPSLEHQRTCLDHALYRATDVLVLLGRR